MRITDTGFDGCPIDSLYGESLSRNPFAWPPMRRVYIDALTEPGLRPVLPLGAIKNRVTRKIRPASEIRAARSEA